MLSELAHGNLRKAKLSDERPLLRDLEAIPFTEDGRTAVLLRDPLQIGEQAVAVAPEFYRLMLLLDGTNTPSDIQWKFSQRLGQELPRSQLESLLRRLDALLFLDNEHFRQEQARVLLAFRSQSVRESVHAGLSYPAVARETNQALSSLYVHPDGAGLAQAPGSREVRALIAPHIDLRLGGPTYTHAYRYLRESILPERFIILGIGHMGLPESFSIAQKDFRTPLGTARCDRPFLAELEKQLGSGTFAEDLSHRTEHSIEFQVLFLQHLFEDRSFSIVPVLTSFSFRQLRPGTDCEAGIGKLIEALRSAEAACPKRTCYIASVDLAHLGPRYGDDEAPDDSAVVETMSQDRALLEPVLRGDAGGFLDRVEADGNRRQVCGVSAIYTLLRLFPGLRGRMLAHNYCRMDETGSVVTYASLAFPIAAEESSGSDADPVDVPRS